MGHNKQVKENIAQLKADVESADSQETLVKVVRSVADHPGPLDYRDGPWWCLLGVLMAVTVFVMVANVLYGYMGVFDLVAGNMSYWILPLLGFFLARRLERQKRWLPLPKMLAKPKIRIGVITLLCALPALLPIWHQLFWNALFSVVAPMVHYLNVVPDPLVMVVAFGLAVSLWLWLHKRQNWRKPLSDTIILKDALLNNGLEVADSKGRMDQLLREFREFNRGNDLKELQALYKGRHEGDVHQFDYELYHYHYVERRTETYTDSNGNTKTRTRRISHYRHGLLLAFPFARSLSLAGDNRLRFKGEDYRTASNAFNRRFKVKVEDPMVAARLLSPAVVESLNALGENVKRPVLEINGSRKMVVAFDDKDLLSVECRYDLDNPIEFAEEIAGHAELGKLQALLETLHNLMRLSDNNFRASA
ncbi:conserved hypothetical protein [Ferrimonas balearica DSM 9799]|uniref:DUF3137 domain-containing protein n=1 Tax=Ferrimonas balearica (strain DSM 9799 / CCM 4581 / KCTC 23876 / PAT) TaxID=550540 RepID=E1SN46_FERBD|nr:DUF3137 domain-containing protein [Ferrimonas balearica]ADN77704.1 conserved hypothetical protein [Ferrimonas balearica DSM 9799]